MKKVIWILQACNLLVLLALFSACQKDIPVPEESAIAAVKEPQMPETQARVVTRTVCFAAIARVGYCNEGEDMLFGGKIDIRENISVDGNGVTHITRHFLARDLTGRAILQTTPATNVASQGTLANNCVDRTVTAGAVLTNKYYTVQGGAEMFSIHFPPGGSQANPTVNLHHGTLVFVNNADHTDRVVARHTRILRDGQIMEDGWDCGR